MAKEETQPEITSAAAQRRLRMDTAKLFEKRDGRRARAGAQADSPKKAN